MPRPAFIVAPTSLAAVAMVAILACWVLRNPTRAAGSTVRDGIRDTLPKYDPKIREAHLSELGKAAEPPESGAEVYGVKPGSTDTLPSSDTSGEVITLPGMIVLPIDNTAKAKPAIQLPRLVVRPVGDDVEADQFETPASRDERLIKKHLSPLDRKFFNRFTIPFMGVTNAQRARDAEAAAQAARRLNEISDLIELGSEGKPQTEEDRKLQKVLLDAFVRRPK